MAVSAAKLEANRRNAQKSTGPRTEAGKELAKFNAVTHGMRAESLILPDEDEQIFEDRKTAWIACLSPRDDVEQRAVDDAVVYSWLQDRARRAQTARLTANLADYGVDRARATEKEVADLGRRLFIDRLGPLANYPIGTDCQVGRIATTSFAGAGADPDYPAMLVLYLQSTLQGCEWLLGEWAKLKAALDGGQPWIPAQKLKAVRLLGKQPFDVIDDRDAAMVFLASSVLKSDTHPWYWEIETEMIVKDKKTFRNNVADLQLESLKPADPAQAREALLGIIERATQRLTVKADAHRERARIEAALAPDLLAFDDSPLGERLRRAELATGRGMARSLDSLRKHRRDVASGRSSVVSGAVESIDAADVTNEPDQLQVANCKLQVASCELQAGFGENSEARERSQMSNGVGSAGCEIVTNEPDQLQVASCELQAGFSENSEAHERSQMSNGVGSANSGHRRENTANEPTNARKITTNEPTDTGKNTTNEPTDDWKNVTNEPTNDCEHSTNEPTDTRKNATNEPTGDCENTTNGPPLAAGGVKRRPEKELAASQIERAREWARFELEKRRHMRAARLRTLNEERPRDAERAKAVPSFGRADSKQAKPQLCSKLGGDQKPTPVMSGLSHRSRGFED